MKINFSKYQGCGNDFIIYDEKSNPILSDQLKADLARDLCQYHYSIGANGILFINPEDNTCAMRLFEQDGSESDMCGNGVRCVAAYLYDTLSKDVIYIKSRAGEIKVIKKENIYQVGIGEAKPIGHYLSIPTADTIVRFSSLCDPDLEKVISELHLNSDDVFMVNVGEPHVVVGCKPIFHQDLHNIGMRLNALKHLFPHGTNVNLVEIRGPGKVINRTFERGVWAETLACGTGSTAVALVAREIYGVSASPLLVENKGGHLSIIFGEQGITLAGPAQRIFHGQLEWGGLS